jgi:hypothetical protein
MTSQTRHTEFTTDERQVVVASYGCGICLDFAHLHGIGPCAHCHPDQHTEHLIATIRAQLAATWAEEHDHHPLGWEGAP